MDINSTNFLSKIITPLEKMGEFKKALREIRKFQKYNPTDELKEKECFILYSSKNYLDAIELGNSYLHEMHSVFGKSHIVTIMQLAYAEIGNKKMVTKLAKINIGLYESVIHDKNASSGDKNLAFSNLLVEYLQASNYFEALKLAQLMLKKLRRSKINEEFMSSLYNQLALIYAKLDNNKKAVEYRSKTIAIFLSILHCSNKTEDYREYARHALSRQYKLIGKPEIARLILQRLQKDLGNIQDAERLWKFASSELSKLYHL